MDDICSEYAETVHVCSNQGFHMYQRSILAKFLRGILPIEIETGRFRNINRELRFCKMCESRTMIEDEIHFLHVCSRSKDAHDEHLKPMRAGFEGDVEKDRIGFTRYLLQDGTIKEFSKVLEAIYMYRKDLLLKPTRT